MPHAVSHAQERAEVDADQYCRDLEAHLCRRNGGHLVRIVGPAFDLVQRWFQLGVPFKVACQGIDRRVDRVATAGARRRPIRLEFCEADVLDAFDAWRRAVGVRGVAQSGEDGAEAEPTETKPRGRSLAGHVERTMARLTSVRIDARDQKAWVDAIDSLVRQLDQLVAPARRARGEARDDLVRELARLDDVLVETAMSLSDAAVVAEASAEADADLAPFRGRMPDAAFAAALTRGRARALRLRLGLPTIGVE